MSTTTVPANMDDAMKMLEAALGMQQCVLRFLAAQDAADLPAGAAADQLRALERTDAVGSALRGRLLEVFDAQDGHLTDGQRTTRTWLVHSLRVTRGQAGEHLATQALARSHRVLHAALAEGGVLTKSEALQLAKWTRAIPDEYRAEAEEILVAAARAGVDLRGLAAICAEIRARTAEADPGSDNDKHLDRGLSLDTTFDGAGVIRGDLSPQCTALVQAVLDALSAPAGGGDLRTRPQRYHDALAGDGGAWLDGDAAREVACDAMIIPVVTGDIDPGAVEELIALCVRYHVLRTAAPAGLTGAATRHAEHAATVADALAEMEHQILGKILQVVSGPGGAASLLRRHLLGKPLAGPSLPLDVGQTDDIPLHLRRLVALRDQTCQFAGGCDQPASGSEPHHVTHRADGGHTSLTNLKNYCWWHHHVVLHELGWTLTVHPDGTSQVQSPDGKIIRSHSPPPRPG